MKITFKPLTPSLQEPVTFELNETHPRITVGRKSDNEFVIPLPNVSSCHAVVEWDTGMLYVEDLNSTNGVFVNGRRLSERTQLHQGDRVAFGSVDFLLETDEPVIQPDSPVQDAAPSPEGTLLVDSQDFADLPGTGAVTEIPPAPGSGARSTVLFGMKDVLKVPYLVLLDGQSNPVREFPLNKPELLVGREPDNDIEIDDVSISRLHARIVKKGESTWQVIDENSTNGVFIEDHKTEKATLHHGTLVRFGDVHAVFLAPGKLFSFEDLRAGKRQKGGLDPKKKLLIGVGAVMVVLILILLLLPGGSGGGAPSRPRLTAEDVMKEVNFSLENQDWDRVVQLVESFQLKGADQQLAKAKKEILNRKKFVAMTEKLKADDFAGAQQILETIDADTSYQERAQQAYQDAVISFIDAKSAEIDQKREETDYTAALALAELLKNTFPDNPELASQYDALQHEAAIFRRKQARRQAYVSQRRALKRSADRKLAEAKREYLKGQLVEALAAVTEAGNAYIAKGMPVPARVRNLKEHLNELRKNYNEGKKLILQGKVAEAAPKLDRVFDISKRHLFGEFGSIEKECTGLLVDFYMEKAEQLYRAQNFVAAYEYLERILNAQPGNRKAASMKREIEGKGQELYNKGYIEQTQYNNCKQALFYFKQVIRMVPRNNPLYKKALKRISDCEK